MIEPVSVCHHVSTIGTTFAADIFVIPHPGFGLIGSPTEPNNGATRDRVSSPIGRPSE
jgi:hypothetical protein